MDCSLRSSARWRSGPPNGVAFGPCLRSFSTYQDIFDLNGGEGEIRTHGRVTPTPVFKTGALNHSTTSPPIGFSDTVWSPLKTVVVLARPIHALFVLRFASFHFGYRLYEQDRSLKPLDHLSTYWVFRYCVVISKNQKTDGSRLLSLLYLLQKKNKKIK